MLYCSNSSCSNPFNPDDNKFCIKCGQTLTPLLRNRFRVIRLLGEGGFSRTYEARDTDKIDEPCVIKQFFPQVQGTDPLEKATELFKQEAKRLYDLGEHPQIPRLIAYFEQDKRLYLVQELIQGQNLLQELQQQGAFSEEKIKQLLTDLLPILKFIHERGVIHRDIKPENIMRRLDGKLILIDFGVSKQITKTFVGVGTTVGTPGYTPLEQMRGQVFPASDLYSLGVTCIRLLTQVLPNADGSDELYDALRGCWIWREYLPLGINITTDLGKVLDKLIQDYVKDRYQSVNDVFTDNCNESQLISSLEPETSSLSMIGTWCGKSKTRTHIFITLCITSKNGNSFDGNLNVRDVNLGWTYRIKINGEIDSKTSEVIIQENEVYSEHFLWKWQKGLSKGKISLDGNAIFGKRSTSVQYDNFYLLRIDCTQMLITLLEAGNWKDADRVTGTLILEISCREKDGWLDSESINRFPCQDIRKINEIWLKYSKGRFGFSVQRKIWLILDRDWIKVGDRLGWRINNRWKEYSELTFSIDAPEGAFPTFWGGEGRKLIFGYSGAWENFFALIRSCKL